LLDRVDRLQHALDLGPAGEGQEDLAAGAHIGDGREGLARTDSAQDVDARDDGAVVVRSPADIGEDAVGCEAQDAPAAIQDLLADIVAEADPVLDPLLQPDQLDMREGVWRMLPARTRNTTIIAVLLPINGVWTMPPANFQVVPTYPHP
jgi:hypothetical protein